MGHGKHIYYSLIPAPPHHLPPTAQRSTRVHWIFRWADGDSGGKRKGISEVSRRGLAKNFPQGCWIKWLGSVWWTEEKWDEENKNKKYAGDYISLWQCSRTTINMKSHIGSSGVLFNCDRTVCRPIDIGVRISLQPLKTGKYIPLPRGTQTVPCSGNKWHHLLLEIFPSLNSCIHNLVK